MAAAFLLASLPASARDTIETYAALPNIGMMHLSPDGNSVAWHQRDGQASTVQVYSISEQKNIGIIRLEDYEDVDNVQFVTDRKLIVTLKFRGFENKVFIYDLDTTEFEALISFGGVVRWERNIGRVVGVSADGQYVWLPGRAGGRYSYSLFRVNLERPENLRLQSSGKRRSIDYFLDEDGGTLAHVYFDTRDGLYEIDRPDGNGWRSIYSADTVLPEFEAVGVTADRGSLVVAHRDAATRRRGLYTMALDNGEITGRFLARDDADVVRVIADVNQVVYGVEYSGAEPAYEFLDNTITRRLADIQERVRGNSVRLMGWSRDWTTLLLYIEGPDFSGHYVSLRDGEATHLASAQSGFDDRSIYPIVSFDYSDDGMTIPALLTAPEVVDDRQQERPAVVLLRGGPEELGVVRFDWMAQALVDRGYLVIQPRVLGATGADRDQLRAGNGERARRLQYDMRNAIAALEAEGLVDPERVCILGSGYGGFLALSGGAFSPDLYRCVIAINAYTDLHDLIDHHVVRFHLHLLNIPALADSLALDSLDKSFLDSISPSENVRNFSAPVMLIHAERDLIAPVELSKRMYGRLKRAGKTATHIELDDDTHDIRFEESRRQTLRAVIDFVDRHLRSTN